MSTSPHNDVPFVVYNGWPNYASFVVYSVFSDSESRWTQLQSQQWAGRRKEAFEHWVHAIVSAWQQGSQMDHHNAIRQMMEMFLGESLEYIDWFALLESLKGNQVLLPTVRPGNSQELTRLVLSLFFSSSVDWQALLDAQPGRASDVVLKSWLNERCLDWIQSPEIRKQQGALSTYTGWVLIHWFGVVDWNQVAETLKKG